MMADMDDDVALRPVAEADLPILERLTQDPESTGEFAWLGWYLTRFRQWWAENRLISDDIGVLMVDRDGRPTRLRDLAQGAEHPGLLLLEHRDRAAARGPRQGLRHAGAANAGQYLFAHTTVQRIEAATEVGNVAEQRALEKAGFTREGVLRRTGWRDGAYRDGVWYSMLRTDQHG